MLAKIEKRNLFAIRDLEKFNYSEEDLMNGKINENWKALMSFQLARARDWFKI